MATKNIYTNILGYDPYERKLQEQKLWSGMYQGAQSPYERMGLALAQLGGTLFSGETEQQKEFGSLNEVIKQVGTQYTPGTAEYYRAVSDALPAEMIESKTRAAQLAVELERKDQEQFRSDVKFLKDNPDQLATEIQGLQTKLENRAIKMGWNPTETAQEVPPEIMSKLAMTPEYKRILQLSNAGQTAIMDRAQKEEKEGLTIESLKTTIAKNKKELADIGDKFDAGTRWNYERQAAIEALAAAGYKPTDKLQGADQLNTALASAQKIALREPWQGGKQPQGVIKLK